LIEVCKATRKRPVTRDRSWPFSNFPGTRAKLGTYVDSDSRPVREFSNLLEDVSGEGKVFARVDRVQIRNLMGAFLEDWQRHVCEAFVRRGPLPGTVKALCEFGHEPVVHKVGTEQALEFLDGVSDPTDLRRSGVEPPNATGSGLEKTSPSTENRRRTWLVQKPFPGLSKLNGLVTGLERWPSVFLTANLASLKLRSRVNAGGRLGSSAPVARRPSVAFADVRPLCGAMRH
jgi:hypothetical protein